MSTTSPGIAQWSHTHPKTVQGSRSRWTSRPHQGGAVGAVDYFGIEHVRAHRTATQHGAGNVIALLLVLVNASIRLPNLEEVVVPGGVALSLITAAILGLTGYLGGELSYKHLIGANPVKPDQSRRYSAAGETADRGNLGWW